MEKIYLLFIFIAAGTTTPFKVVAGKNDSALHTKVMQWMSNAGEISFLENKGQMMDMQRKAVKNVLFKAGAGGVDVYITTSGLSYVFVKFEKHKKKNSTHSNFKHVNDSITETYCRADMQLVGATIKKENTIQEGESTDRSDYYYGDVCPNGILNVHSYGKVTIKNIYPGIDWVLHGGKQGLKYDFVVHPGANPSLIRLNYIWTDKPQLQNDGSVKINTPMGNITEETPVSYNGNEQSKVQTTYSIENREIHFKISKYNSAETLVIDPALVWGTYYGDGLPDLNEVGSMQEDGKNVSITGQTSSPGFPTLNPGGGAYFQGTFPGNGTVYILQFNTAGVLKWATYYGGTGGDDATSIYSDGTNVWVTGITESSDFPVFNPGGGAYFQPTHAYSFIIEFSTTGVRKWATFFGGSVREYANSIQSDGTHVWLTGESYSRDLPTLNPGGGAYFQPTIAGGANVFIAEFNTAGVMLWSTYYGGNSIQFQEGGQSIYSDGRNVWLTGFTSSTNFPTLNPGGGAFFQPGMTGTYNSFIVKFNTAGVRKWATCYGGSSSDVGNSIFSNGSKVWVTGGAGSTDFPTLNPGKGAFFQGTNKALSNVFILQFDTAGVRKWATYYGGSNKSVGYTIQNADNNVWVCGATSFASDFPTLNPGCGFYEGPAGNGTFMLQFDTVGVRKWATYYGADQENDGSYAWSDGKYLFIAGDAEIHGYPMKNPGGGAYFDDTVRGAIENIYIGKFILPGNLTLSPDSNLIICKGDSVQLSAAGSVIYNWSPPAGLSATNIPDPVASPTVTTTYTVTGTDTAACGGIYTDTVQIVVENADPGNIKLSKDTFICDGASVNLTAAGGATYSWSNGATTSSIAIPNDTTTNTYTVHIINNACRKDTSLKVTVTVFPLPHINVSGNKLICQGDSLQLDASGGASYLWSNGDTTTSYNTGAINADLTVKVTAYNSLGCSHDTTIKVIPNIPALNACCNGTIIVGNDTTLVAKGNTTKPYKWSPEVTCLNPPLCDSVKVSPTVTTAYTVTITDSAGCTVERILTIIVEEKPCFNFTIPNVFTPDNPGPIGLNRVFYIKTTDLDSWSLIIYDRWGKEMYRSINLHQYWDGNTESGSKAPDGVYYYIIRANCRDNTYKKDGFVQLIR